MDNICHITEENDGFHVNLRPLEIKEALKGKLSEYDINNAYNEMDKYNRFQLLQ